MYTYEDAQEDLAAVWCASCVEYKTECPECGNTYCIFCNDNCEECF